MPHADALACSLGAGDLEQRLAAMAEIGAATLTGSSLEGGRQVLRFRADDATRRRLEEIVAAEALCCSFLDLALCQEAGELVLTITASDEAQPVAASLAVAFTGR